MAALSIQRIQGFRTLSKVLLNGSAPRPRYSSLFTVTIAILVLTRDKSMATRICGRTKLYLSAALDIVVCEFRKPQQGFFLWDERAHDYAFSKANYQAIIPYVEGTMAEIPAPRFSSYQLALINISSIYLVCIWSGCLWNLPQPTPEKIRNTHASGPQEYAIYRQTASKWLILRAPPARYPRRPAKQLFSLCARTFSVLYGAIMDILCLFGTANYVRVT